MSKQDEEERLNRFIDQAVEEFLLVPDERVLERTNELEGPEGSLALDFDRLMAPILSRHEAQATQDSRIVSAVVPKWTWRGLLLWNRADNLARVMFSRPMRSAFASLFLVAVGTTLSLSLWRAAPQPDSTNVDSAQGHLSRNVPKDASGQRPSAPSGGGDSAYIAQLAEGANFTAVAEALDRMRAKYPTLFRDQPLVIRRAKSGDAVGAYLGGVGGLKSERDAEQICGKFRAGGDPCSVVNVPNEQSGR